MRLHNLASIALVALIIGGTLYGGLGVVLPASVSSESVVRLSEDGRVAARRAWKGFLTSSIRATKAEIKRAEARGQPTDALYDRLDGSYRLWSEFVAPSTIPAFPGATGYGADALNDCRALPRKVEKFDLATSGATSLQTMVDGFHDDTFNIAIADTSGTVQDGTITPNADCFIIAGQTARGGFLYRPSGTGAAIQINNQPNPSNLLITYMRFRGNIEPTALADLIQVVQRDNFDSHHYWYKNSLSYGNDGIFDYTIIGNTDADTLKEVGISHSLLYGCNVEHCATALNRVLKYTSFRNVFSIGGGRQPFACNLSGDHLLIQQAINTVTYNWRAKRMDLLGTHCQNDVINNWGQRAGLETSRRELIRMDDAQGPGAGSGGDNAIYIAGNVVDSAGTVVHDANDEQWNLTFGGSEAEFRVGTPNADADPPTFPVTPVAALTAKAELIGASFSTANITAGAHEYVNCDGTWTQFVDATDSTAVRHIFDLTGTEQGDESGYGGYGAMDPQPRCTDTDGDGMPDAYENLYSNIDASVADASDDTDNDGWLAIEEYLSKCASGNSCSPDDSTAFDATEADVGGGSGGPTYGNGHHLYEDTLVLDTMIRAGGADTVVRLIPTPSCWTPSLLFRYWPLAGTGGLSEGDTVVVVRPVERTCGMRLLDSLQVDSLIAAWGLDTRGITTTLLRDGELR